MRNKLTLLGLVLSAFALHAQTPEGFRVELPTGAPVAMVAADWGASRATPRGGAMLVELHSTLQLKNTGARRIRAVSLLVTAQESTPGGRASITVPSLDVEAGETFPVRMDLRLVRPMGAAGAPVVKVELDGILFEDLGFYGPNRMNARRAMLVWESEARRDRHAMLALLERNGAEGLRQELLSAMARRAAQPRLEVQAARAGSATNVAATHEVALAALHVPDAPVELTGGTIHLAGNEARDPVVRLRNIGAKPVHTVDVAWLVRDAQGREYAAGSLPAVALMQPGARANYAREGALRFATSNGAPAQVASMTGWVSVVEFADGSVWTPSRNALNDARLRAALPLSGEQERLVELYRRKGLDAVVAELRKLR